MQWVKANPQKHSSSMDCIMLVETLWKDPNFLFQFSGIEEKLQAVTLRSAEAVVTNESKLMKNKLFLRYDDKFRFN